jgi:GTP pyrophosphokinase
VSKHRKTRRFVTLLHRQLLKSDKLLAVANKLNLPATDDLYALVGYGELTAEGVLHRIREDIPKRTLDELRTTNSAIIDQGCLPIQVPSSGIDGMLFRLSKCCEPIPGDMIVGYVTRGKGVTIHRIDCPNLRKIREDADESQRLMALDWQETGEGMYQADLEIVALDRVGLLADISNIFSETKTNIRSAQMTSDPKKHTAHIILRVDTSGVNNLKEMIARINVLSDIMQIHRRRAGS